MTKKLKVTEVSQEDPLSSAVQDKNEAAAVKDYHFLAGAMGMASDTGEDEEKGDPAFYKSDSAGLTQQRTGGGNGDKQMDDLDEASVILNSLRTSDDAINFFARYGSETSVKFVHFKSVDDPREFRPYDLERIDGDLPVNEPYYTMSPAGIVHVVPGETCEVLPLSAWMRQGMLFRILRNISFYKYFLHRRAFSAWRDNVRYQLFVKQRKAVGARLFMARKTTSGAIMLVKKHLMNVQNVRLLYLDGSTIEKEEFTEQQTQNCVKSGAECEEAMRLVTNEVQTVIMQIQSMHSRAGSDGNEHVEEYSDDVPEKHKSLLKLRQEKLERAQMRKQAKLEYATLPDFIRFVDYMAVEALVELLLLQLSICMKSYAKRVRTAFLKPPSDSTKKEVSLPPRAKSSRVWSTVLSTPWSIQLAR